MIVSFVHIHSDRFQCMEKKFHNSTKVKQFKRKYMAKIITGTMSAGDKQQQKLQVIKL